MKIITKVLILVTILLISFNIQTYAIVENADGFLELGKQDQTNTINQNALQDASTTIYNILFVLALILAIAIGMIIGIQFITGSVEEKAQIKETLVPYIVGCFIIFSAFTIWKIVIEVGNDIEGTTSQGTIQPSTSTTYTEGVDGNLYCDSCGGVLTTREQHNGQCFDCNQYITGI